MRSSNYLCLIACLVVGSASLWAQDHPPAPPAPAPEQPKPEPEKPESKEPKVEADKPPSPFTEMTPTYRTLILQAFSRFQARDFRGALIMADKADALQLPSVWTLNIRGAVAIERREFEEGARFCKAALDIDPNFFPAKFNMCEIPFLKGQYAEARGMWEKLLEGYPANRIRKQDADIPELLSYRIFLCYVLANDKANAKIWLDKLPTPSATPAYFYANAIWEREAGRQDKWKEWIKQAEYVWPESQRANFVDVLFQLGWMNPPQAEGAPISNP